MLVHVFSFKSMLGQTSKADFYIRRHYTERGEMVFDQRSGKKTVNCFGIKVFEGDVDSLVQSLRSVDWKPYAINGVGAIGTIAKPDIYEVLSQFVSPLFDIRSHVHSRASHPSFYIAGSYGPDKQIIKKTLGPQDRPSHYYGVYVLSGDMDEVMRVFQGISWQNISPPLSDEDLEQARQYTTNPMYWVNKINKEDIFEQYYRAKLADVKADERSSHRSAEFSMPTERRRRSWVMDR